MSLANHCRSTASLSQHKNAALANLVLLDIIRSNIPAMPLVEAHFGGFFLLGVCQ